MRVALTILGGPVLIGNVAPAAMGQRISGHNVTLNLEPDTRAKTDRRFAVLNAGGEGADGPTEMPWDGYSGNGLIAPATSGCSAATQGKRRPFRPQYAYARRPP
jgi:hypothetical protein